MNLDQFSAMTKQSQLLWIHVGQIVTEVKHSSSLRRAAKKFNRDPRTVQNWARPALRKLRNGRWAAKTHDQLLRVLTIPTKEGLVEIGVPDSRQATIVSEYSNAVERYISTGDASALRGFQGRYITDADGTKVRLLTDTRALDRLASAGVLSFESLYAGAA